MPVTLLQEIAVFVLGTTSYLHQASSYDARIIPIMKSWGGDLQHLYFVFGASRRDNAFMINRGCALSHTLDSASADSVEDKSAIEKYGCPIYSGEISNVRRKEVSILRFMSCSSGYFGPGPTCRCEESLRYFQHYLENLRWFIFQDDDVYLRPIPLQQMLSCVSQNTAAPVAIVSAKFTRGLYFSKEWDRIDNKMCSYYQFPYAQPAILNFEAVRALDSLVKCNGLSRLRNKWRGTHDHLLGLALWLYNIPVYSLAKIYFTDELYHATNITSNVMLRSQDKAKVSTLNRYIVFHRLRNWSVTDSKTNTTKRTIGHLELYDYLNDTSSHKNILTSLGEESFKVLFRIKSTSLSNMNSSNKDLESKIRNIRYDFFDFSVDYC